MPHVSKKKLTEKSQKYIESRFLAILKKPESIIILKDILTDTELTMLAKRLLVIIFLAQGYGFRKISQALKMSTSTVDRYAKIIDKGGFENIRKLISKNSKENEVLENFIASLFNIKIPSYNGKNRWKWLDKVLEK